MMNKVGAAQRKGVNSVEIGFQLLSYLADRPGPVTLKELSQATGMAPSKAHSYLVSYLRIGLVVQDPATGRYGLGPEALRLGLAALRQLDVVEAAREPMRILRETTGFTVSLAVWGNQGPTIVKWDEGEEPVLADPRIGVVMPVLWSSLGRVFLTYLPETRTRTIVKRELRKAREMDQPPINAAAIEAIKTAIRKEGLAIREEPAGMVGGDIYQPTRAIAAPVFGYEGMLSAVLTLVGPARSLDIDPTHGPAKALLEATAAFSRALGYRPLPQ
jgi:DNA-binding IclR family transcriptional regulator